LLDKTTANFKRKKVKDTILKLDLDPRKSKEINEILDWLKTAYDKRMAQAVKIIKRQTSKNEKTHTALEARIAYSDHNREQNDLILGFSIDCLQKRLSDLEAIVQSITEKLKFDLPSVKTEMENLKKTLSSPEMSTVTDFVKKALAIEAEKKAEYERKLRENDLAT
jgi:hypothetical protein